MIARQAAAPRAVHEHRHAPALGEGREVLGRVIPVDAAARDHHRTLGAGQEIHQALDRVGIGPLPLAVDVARGDRRQAVLHQGHEEIHRDLDEHRARAAGERGADRRRQYLGDLSRLGHGPRALGDGPQQRHLLGFLERPQPTQPQRRRSADEKQRAPRRVGVGHAGHGIGHAGSGRDDSHANVPRQPRVGVRRMGAGLLVAHVHDPDPLGHAAVVDGQDVAAAEREDVPHAGLLESPRDEVPAGQVRHDSPSLLGGTVHPLELDAAFTAAPGRRRPPGQRAPRRTGARSPPPRPAPAATAAAPGPCPRPAPVPRPRTCPW